MPEIKEEKLVQVANESLDIIHHFYRIKGQPSDDDYTKAKLASSMFGTFVKYRQHQSNMSAVKMAVATQILENPEDRELYLRLSAPELQLGKIKESKLLEAGISPETIKPKTITTDEQGYIQKAE